MTLMLPTYFDIEKKGDGEIITEDETIPFSIASFMTELEKVHDDKNVKSFDINIFTELTIRSDYKGLFRKVKKINGNVKLIDVSPYMFNDCEKTYLGDGEIITKDKTIPFSIASFMTVLEKVHDDVNVEYFDINIITKLTVTRDYKGLFEKVKKINGSIKLTGDMSYMFNDCDFLIKIGDSCDTSNVTDMSSMFYGSKSFNQKLKWDTKNVTDMSNMFCGTLKFNEKLKFSDTSNVIDMSSMFCGAISFNQELNFDTSNVTNMAGMFYGATSFNQSLKWDTKLVVNMSYMFCNAKSFNKPLYFDKRSALFTNEMFDKT